VTEEREASENSAPEIESGSNANDVVVLPIEDSIDLHTFDPREVESVVESYIEAAWDKGFGEVRVVHGRGKGVQRARIRAVLARDPHVQAFGDAPGHRGGWGATLVWLKPRA
jgi:DNA-nicking Smr family endonuclease